MKTEILKPTTGGYFRMGQLMADVLLAEAADFESAKVKMSALLEIAAYLGALGERDVHTRLLSLTPDKAE